MASEETIADILAEMFDFSDKRIEEGRDHAMTSESVGLIVHQLAKRFEAAWKRESVGNAAAMHEACVNIAGYAQTAKCHTEDGHVLGYLDQIEKWAKAAFAAPPRQCDVGTAEEHAQRFYSFCERNSSGINGMCKPTCPCIDCFDRCQCFAKWSQMPCEAEEGAAK